jgi:hypothetical protein
MAPLLQAVLATPDDERDIVDPVEMRATLAHILALPSRATGGTTADSKAAETAKVLIVLFVETAF